MAWRLASCSMLTVGVLFDLLVSRIFIQAVLRRRLKVAWNNTILNLFQIIANMLFRQFLFLVTILCNGAICKLKRQSTVNFSPDQQEQLERIQSLARDGGLAAEEVDGITRFDETVCYSKQCLDSAEEIMKATNFTANPCTEWREYACQRRIRLGDTSNHLDVVRARVEEQTLALLEDYQGRYGNDLLLKEAQTYFYQCKNKELNDPQDVTWVLNYMSSQYGNWPLLTGQDASESFSEDWVNMVADMNKFVKNCVNPLIIKGTVGKRPFGKFMVGVDNTHLPWNDATYRALLQRIFDLNNIPNSRDRVSIGREDIQYFEQMYFSVYRTPSNPRDYSVATLQEMTDRYAQAFNLSHNFNWQQFLNRVFDVSGFSISSETVLEVDYGRVMTVIEIVSKIISDRMSNLLANVLHTHMVSMLLHETTVLMDDLVHVECDNEFGSHASRCLEKVKTLFGYSLGQSFLTNFYKSKTTSELEHMMLNIRHGYQQIIDDTTWMKNQTSKFLIDKLQKMRVSYARPSWMNDTEALKQFYSGLRGSTNLNGSYPENFLSVHKWALGKERVFNLRPVNIPLHEYDMVFDLKWSVWLGEVNAQYNVYNQIHIHGGFPQVPVYESGRPGFMNYGAIGMVIGHEIGHSFDTRGRTWNTEGQQGEFWDQEDSNRYNQIWVERIKNDYRATKINQLGFYDESLPESQTVNEDIADIFGVFVSFESYLDYLKELKQAGKTELILAGLKNFSPEKLFYMKYTNTWCSGNPNDYRILSSGQVHSPPNVRAVMPLTRSAQFAETFGCPVPEKYD